jgi:putative polyketide hydroxylase
MEELVKGKEFSLCRIDREEVIGLFTSINLSDVWVFHILDTSAPPPQPTTARDSSATWQHTQETTKAHYTPAECERLIKIAMGMPEKSIEVVSILPWDSAMNVMNNFTHGRIFFAGT